MGQFGIGQSVTRLEDPRLLRGQGRYINDINLPAKGLPRVRAIAALAC